MAWYVEGNKIYSEQEWRDKQLGPIVLVILLLIGLAPGMFVVGLIHLGLDTHEGIWWQALICCPVLLVAIRLLFRPPEFQGAIGIYILLGLAVVVLLIASHLFGARFPRVLVGFYIDPGKETHERKLAAVRAALEVEGTEDAEIGYLDTFTSGRSHDEQECQSAYRAGFRKGVIGKTIRVLGPHPDEGATGTILDYAPDILRSKFLVQFPNGVRRELYDSFVEIQPTRVLRAVGAPPPSRDEIKRNIRKGMTQWQVRLLLSEPITITTTDMDRFSGVVRAENWNYERAEISFERTVVFEGGRNISGPLKVCSVDIGDLP